jgi:hypothetical protein
LLKKQVPCETKRQVVVEKKRLVEWGVQITLQTASFGAVVAGENTTGEGIALGGANGCRSGFALQVKQPLPAELHLL